MTGPDNTNPMLIKLPWPHKELSPNSRAHWGARARRTASARRFAAYACKAHHRFDNIKDADCTGYKLTFGFFPPDRRRRDLDNIQASMKASIDGIADALGVDDSAFEIEWPTHWGEVTKNGVVAVFISPARLCMAAERGA